MFDHLFLLGCDDEAHDPRQNLLSFGGLLFEEPRNLVGGKLQQRVQLLELLVGLGQQPSEVLS